MPKMKKESQAFQLAGVFEAHSTHKNPSGEGQLRACFKNAKGGDVYLDEAKLKERKEALESRNIKADVTDKALAAIQAKKASGMKMGKTG